MFCALAELPPDSAGATLGEYLDANRYSEPFVQRYLVPMTSAIWSSSFDGIRQFPAQMLVRFMHNHGMLTVSAQPLWQVVCGRPGDARGVRDRGCARGGHPEFDLDVRRVAAG